MQSFTLAKPSISKYGLATYDMLKNPKYRKALYALENKDDEEDLDELELFRFRSTEPKPKVNQVVPTNEKEEEEAKGGDIEMSNLYNNKGRKPMMRGDSEERRHLEASPHINANNAHIATQ